MITKAAFTNSYEVKLNGIQIGLISKSILKGWSFIWFNNVLTENNMPTFDNDVTFPTVEDAKNYFYSKLGLFE